ncbi:MAG: hypothetical protein IPK08_22065 [Bacteroidetes bacterium]|nr:hypothetical protein [Bacteroidota bacterium]
MKLKYILFIIILIAASSSSFATSYTWVGTSSSWNLSSNWSPSGIPDSADNVTITSGTYSPLLDGNRKITNLTLSSKTIDLNGFSLTVYGTATMTSGTVTNGTFYARGNLASFNGTLMDCPVDAVCGYIRLSGSTFNETADFTDLGAATGTGSGGCTFNDDVTITHTGTLTYFTLANTTGDTFNGNVTFTNSSNREIHIASSGATLFNGNVILNSTSSGGISFASGGGSAILANGKTISIGSSGFSADFLTLKNFTQNGSTAQTLTLTGTAVVNMIAATFNGNITITAPGILLKNSTFNGTTTLTRNGSSGNHQSDGGNTFNILTLNNAGSSGRVRWATTLPDTYNADATFNSTGGQDVQIAYSGDNTFAGNITTGSNKVVFNTSTGKVTFTGTNNQTLNGSYNYPFKKLAINKSSGTVTANTTLSVDDSLIFIQGNLITTSTNLLTMKHGSTATGASNSSFVSGPVKKVGNNGFRFPIGADYEYRMLEMSSPSTTSSEFTCEFISDTTLANSGARDTSIGYINRTAYWKLNRTVGTSQVYVTLSWDTLSHLADTFVTIASWNGSMWKDLGMSILTGTKLSGSVKSSIVSSSYNEFALGYAISSAALGGCDCQNIQSAICLEKCLNNATSGQVLIITSNFEINEPLVNLPLNISTGVTLIGSTGSNRYLGWWSGNSPKISSSHTRSYFANFCKCNSPLVAGCNLIRSVCRPQELFLFTMEPGSVFQNIRLQGANCHFHNNNQADLLCGGIYVFGDASLLTVEINNSEISCFSYMGVQLTNKVHELIFNNNYVHKVKGKTETIGVGYGLWMQAKSIQISGNPQLFNITNGIFDDCKAAIDGQGYPADWLIYNNSFSQHFFSEDINRHNDNRFRGYKGVGTFDYHYCYFGATCPGNGFYGPQPNISTLTCETVYSNPVTYVDQFVACDEDIPTKIYDIGGAKSYFVNNIFHRAVKIGDLSSNINLNFPNRDVSKSGLVDNGIYIQNNTFATEHVEPEKLATTTLMNRGGYARIANNYIEACVWSADPYIDFTGNNFNYKFGSSISGSPQPCEVSLKLKTTGNVDLPESNTISPYREISKIQYIEKGTDFKIATQNPRGANDQTYIIRSNPNNGTPVTGSSTSTISGSNYHYDNEEITDGNTTLTTITGYSDPGLYGIDVLALDANIKGSSPDFYFDFKASDWNHIPVIVNDPGEEQVLYFNIKDSFKENVAIASTGVFKRAYLNDLPIWEEDIADGGDGWEYVRIDLKGTSEVTSTPIFEAIHTDGRPNKLKFSIFLENDLVSASLVQGVAVYIDDIYIKQNGSSTADNLVRDGSVELSVGNSNCNPGTNGCFWYDEDIKTYTCSTATAPCKFYINSFERKSGNYALMLELPVFPKCTTDYNAASSGEIAVSAVTEINVTDLLSCEDYWDDITSTSSLGFTEFDGTLATYTGEKFYIGNDIVIGASETLEFFGCELAIAPGVEIKIEQDGVLNIGTHIISSPAETLKTNIFSCDEMWQGIIVEDGGILNINGFIATTGLRNCKISDAVAAIYCPGNSSGTDVPTLTLIAVDFSNNLISIGAENVDLGIADIVGCNFNATSGMLTKIPHDGVYPQNHIKLENVSEFLIGTGTSINLLNEFSGVQMGVFANESSLSVNGSVFDNLINYSVSPTQKGTGINAQNSTTTPRTLEVDSRFRNLQRGIFTRGNFDVNIHDCDQFRDIDGEAISINSMNYDRSITIINNLQFQRNNIGIRVSGGRLNSVTISNNHFDNSAFVETSNGAFHNTAITVQKWSSQLANPVTGITEIFDNGILNHRNGIHAINIENVRIGGYDGSNNPRPNTISYNLSNSALSEAFHGIWIQNCNKADILANDIENDDPTTETNLRGIVVDNSDNANIGSNTIGQMGRAMQFEGFCLGNPGTQLLKNDMTDFEVGIHLENGQIPNQGTTVPSIVPWDNKWINDINDPSMHNKVDGQLLQPTPISWYFQGTDGDNADPFVPSPRGPNLIFPDDGHSGGTVTCMNTNRIGEFERDLAFGSVAADTMSFEYYEDELKYAFKDYLYELLKQNDSLLTLGLPSDSVFQRFFTHMDSTNIGSFGIIRQALDSNLIDTAEFINDNITESNSIELYRKSVNEILISKIFEDINLDGSDSTLLENIFSKHWIEAGMVIYDVAGILGQEYHSPQISFKKRPNDSTNMSLPKLSKRIVKFSPNPTRDKVTILGTENTTFEIEIIDMYNRVCLRKTNTKEIDLSMFANGIYSIRVLMENVPYSGKLVLLK